MNSFEITDRTASKLVIWASKDVYRDQDSPSWNPYNRGEQLLTVWAIEQAQGVIDNGGFEYFFGNDWPENPSYSVFIDAFRRIGAMEAADCIQDAVDMFPSPNPHLDYQLRRDYMTSLRTKEGGRDSVIDKLGDRVIDLGGDTYMRLARYILYHIEIFPTAGENLEKGAKINNDSFMSRIQTNICRRSAAGLAVIAWLLVAMVASGLSQAETGGIETNNPASKPTFYGVVLTTNNVPITNAMVTIKKMLAGRGAVYVSDAPDCNRQAMTKADGSFAFEGLAEDANFMGVVTAPGYELLGFCTGPWWNGPEAGKQGFWCCYPGTNRPLQIKMCPALAGDNPQQTIHGRVVNTDGKPVAGAKIMVPMLHTERDWHSGGGMAFTDQQGEFAFRPAEEIIACDFTIEADGYVSRSFSEVAPGAGTNVYQLSQGARLTGRLLKDGQPLPDAGIGIYGVNERGFLCSYSTATDGNGRFTFSGLPTHEEFYLFGIMRSLRELGALPRQHVKTGDNGTSVELGDLKLEQGYTISGRVLMANGKPTSVGAFTLARTELTPPTDHTPTKQEESNRSFYGLEQSFDNWRADPGPDGKFEFNGVPGETVSIFLMLKPFDMLSPRNISSDGKGFRLLGTVVSNKTDLVIELEPHSRQVFPPARDYKVLSRQPLQGAEAGKTTPMTRARLLILFTSILATYSLALFVIYRPLTRPSGVRLFHSTKLVEITTAEERSRGESSFDMERELGFGIERKGFFVLAMAGYIVLSVGFAIAFIVLFRLAHA